MDFGQERKLLKTVVLWHLYRLLHGLFGSQLRFENFSTLECYAMDTRMIQQILREIVESGHYTLEGIAYYTRVPFDVILDAACGRNQQFFVTSWAKVVDLYVQVKPEMSRLLLDRLMAMQEENEGTIRNLLHDP